ncbi:hypothetical protein KAR91_53420 [Candidatus Pacearchaeota archaeon]|nr:hypothetical protein [Candidatus Pacearchaeota archaeon]
MSLVSQIVYLVSRLVPVHLSKVRTNIPAQVISYDPANNTCSVQPSIMQIRSDDPNNLEPLVLPQVDDIPVKQQGSGKFLLSIAPAVGSYGELRVFDRDISKWLQEGGTQSPGSTRQFHFSDAIFDPGIYPLKADGDNGKLAVPVATDRISLRLRDGTAEMSVLEDGNIEVKMPSGKTVTFNTSADAAALASVVDGAIAKLDDALRSFIPVPQDGGAALQTYYKLQQLTAPPTSASEILKVEK